MNATCPETAEWQELANAFANLYNERSPISFTVVAAAIIEDQVLRTLRKTIPGIKGLGNHSMRVKILREMGIITKSVAAALLSFADIRNVFAHSPHTTTFDTPEIQKHTKTLREQMEIEGITGTGAVVDYATPLANLEARFKARGVQAPWSDPTARTLVVGFLSLTYYLIWARYWAPMPQTPKSFAEIGKHDCGKAKT